MKRSLIKKRKSKSKTKRHVKRHSKKNKRRSKKFGLNSSCQRANINTFANYCGIYMKQLKTKFLSKGINFDIETLKNECPAMSADKFQISDDVYKKISKIGKNDNSFMVTNGIVAYRNPYGPVISPGSNSGEPIINLYKCVFLKDPSLDVFRFGTYMSTVNKSFLNFTTDTIKEKLGKLGKITKNKKVMCISLLSPNNGNICSQTMENGLKLAEEILPGHFDVGNKLVKYELLCKENDILSREIGAINENLTVISLPLSASKHSSKILNLFNYESHKNKLLARNNVTQLEKDIYPLLKTTSFLGFDNGEETFKSIVKFAYYFYYNLKNTHVLAFHCKSGCDRSGIFDAILHASFYNIVTKTEKNQIPGNEDYKKIKKYSQKFLLCSLFLIYYAKSFVGFKINNIPTAKYILDDPKLFEFYMGQSKQAGSSN